MAVDIRTAEQLNSVLSRQYCWRVRELHEVRDLVHRSRCNQTAQEAAIRAGIAMLYAHWEGFVKEAGTAYVHFVAKQRLAYEELAVNFVAMAMKRRLNDAMGTQKATVYNDVAEFFVHRMAERCVLPWRSAVATQSNLSSCVLKEIVCALGLDYGFFETKEKLIDHLLLDTRNNIAHGEYLTVEKDDFMDLYDQVIAMMRVFKDQIDNAASLRSYLRCSNHSHYLAAK